MWTGAIVRVSPRYRVADDDRRHPTPPRSGTYPIHSVDAPTLRPRRERPVRHRRRRPLRQAGLLRIDRSRLVPSPRLANYASGAAEITLGLGLLSPRTRRVSAFALIGLVGAVFPANIDMAVNKVEVKPVDGRLTRQVGTAHGPANWIRLPLQIPVAWWLWREARRAS